MLANSITVITALTMLAHSVWGCCWHHAHDDHGAQACTASHVESADHREHDHCSHSSAERPTGSSSASQNETSDHGHQDDHQHLPCHEAQCTYVVTAPVSIDGFCAEMATALPLTSDLVVQSMTAVHRWDIASTSPPRDAHAVRAQMQSWLL